MNLFWASWASLVCFGICSANVTETALLDDAAPPPIEKNNSLSCKVHILGPRFYILLPNKSVLLLDYNELVDERFYNIENESLHYCIPRYNSDGVLRYVTILDKITFASMALSMTSLFLHLVVFCLVPDLRNLPGWNVAALCACLFVSYAMEFLKFSDEILRNSDTCIALAYTTYFFQFSSFLWMSIISFSVFASILRATRKLRSSDTRFENRKFGLNCLCAFGVTLLFNVSAVLVDNLEGVPEHWRPMFREGCWFLWNTPSEKIFFDGPIFLMTCINFFLFAASACIVHAKKRKCDQDAQKPAMQRRYMMYFRLSAIAGVTWIFGIWANKIRIILLELLFILLNTLQGFFIFLGFTCSVKVKKYFREKILGARRSSEQSLTPTFQSYCVYSTDAEDTVESRK